MFLTLKRKQVGKKGQHGNPASITQNGETYPSMRYPICKEKS
jgi:hypothetical protein